MPRLADGPPNLRGSPKNTFDREPLLIPQLYVNGKPWYRRRGTVLKVIVCVLVVLAFAFLVHRVTAVVLLKRFANFIPK